MAGDPSGSGLFLKTFGGAVLHDASGPIDVPPKQMALLVLLRLHAPRSRKELERFLWQREGGDTGNALSQALGPLRTWFPDLPRGKGPFVWPGRERLATDVDVLQSAEHDPSAREAAVFAYQGVFLKHFREEEGEEEFRHWVQQRQDDYEGVFRRLWQQEAADAVAGARWEYLEKLARHAVQLDRFWQPGHAALVRALAGSGRPDAARRHFVKVKQQLEEEDGGYPLDEALLQAGARIDEWAAAAVPARTLGHTEAVEPPAAAAPTPYPRRPAHEPRPAAGPPWRRRAPILALGAAAALALALVLGLRGGEDGQILAGAGDGRTHAGAPLCRPGEARASLVEQDFKADPANVVPPSTHFTTVWHLQNVGRCTWPASFRLHRQGAKPLSISDRDIPAQRTVAPGDTILFPSSMVAPHEEGLHREEWVLLEESGRPVRLVNGQDRLAAAIRVLVGAPRPCGPGDVKADLVTRGYPDDWPVRPGERFTYEWTFMNRAADCAWDDALALRFVSSTPGRLSDTRIAEIRMEERVSPSEGYTFEIPMRAPAREGTYVEQWSLAYRDGRVIPVQGAATVQLRMAVRSDVAALPMPRLCGRGEYAVAWMKTERPADGTVVRPGGRIQRKVTLANKGACTWDRGLRLAYVRSEFGQRPQSFREIPITRLVPPRASYTFTIPIQVPRTGTQYREYWSVVNPYGDTTMVSLVKAFWADLVIAPN